MLLALTQAKWSNKQLKKTKKGPGSYMASLWKPPFWSLVCIRAFAQCKCECICWSERIYVWAKRLRKACMERRYRKCEEPSGPQQRPTDQVATSPNLSAQAGRQRSPALYTRSQDPQGRGCFSSRTTSTCQGRREKTGRAQTRQVSETRILCHIILVLTIHI